MKELTQVIQTASQQAYSQETSDYIQDGIRYCGKCHTPKQCIKQFGPVKKKMNCLCRCEYSEKEKARSERKERQRFEELQSFKRECIQDNAMQCWNFEADTDPDSKQMRYARRYVEKWEDMYAENLGLCFYGSVGTGKSFAAACIANALVARRIPVMMTNFSRIINGMPDMWSGERNAYIESFNRYKLLIIDDLGVERSTDYAMEQVYNIIDQRYKNKQPLIVTTNLAWRDIKNCDEKKMQRIYDRIVEMCLPVQIDGISKRSDANLEKRTKAKVLFRGC